MAGRRGLAIGLTWWWLGARTSGTGEISPVATVKPAGPVLTVILRAENARWNLANPPDAGDILHGVPVKLTEGTLALSLVGGQTVTLRAPARFELINADEMRLDAGDISLMKTDGGQPYIIRVPEGAVADLGTEFFHKCRHRRERRCLGFPRSGRRLRDRRQRSHPHGPDPERRGFRKDRERAGIQSGQSRGFRPAACHRTDQAVTCGRSVCGCSHEIRAESMVAFRGVQ